MWRRAAPSGSAAVIVCFDIGGTTMKGGYARAVEDINVLERVPTPGRDFDAFVGVLARAIADCPAPPRALAAAIPGIIEPGSGLGVVANVPCISGIPVRERLEAALGLPVALANDADCFALAEVAVGAGRGHRVVLGIILGTGVGGGLVIEGRLINAEGGFAGEWGHGPVAARLAGTPVVEIPRFRCGCGLSGCLDATVSARGMEALHRHLHGKEATSLAIVAGWGLTSLLASQAFDVVAVKSVSFSGPSADTLMALINSPVITPGFDIGLVPGVFAGSFLAAILTGQFKVQGFESGVGVPRYLAGATLMGFGSMLAGGCAVGAGVTGGSVLALTAWIALLAMWLGAGLTDWLIDREASPLKGWRLLQPLESASRA